MDTENIDILQEDVIFAQNLCASIDDKNKRSRAVANILGIKIAESYFSNLGYKTDTESGLHNIPSILEDYEISDIYVNNFYVDVRVYFEDDEICVPKLHFDAEILPSVYMFIKISPDLRSASVGGFIYPEYIDTTESVDDVYYLSGKNLASFYDIEPHFRNQPDILLIDDEKIYNFADCLISDDKNTPFIKDLLKSANSRLKLIYLIKAQSLFNMVSTVEAVPHDTELSPNDINGIEEEAGGDEEVGLTEDDLESLFVAEEQNGEEHSEFKTSVTPSSMDIIETLDAEEANSAEEDNTEQIETLFTGEQEGVPASSPKKTNVFLTLFVTLLLIAGGIYLFYNYTGSKNPDNNIVEEQQNLADAEDYSENSSEQNTSEDAMPVETVETSAKTNRSEVSNSAPIPAIENNLDASVLVSNLKVDWEVPEGYASNTAAKRYLVKLGKIIQLNLKTELLLLQKPPLSNKISVELKYNPSAGKFETVGIRDSSGEKSVDEAVLQTVNSVLKMSLSSNMESISKLQGAPVLIIHL